MFVGVLSLILCLGLSSFALTQTPSVGQSRADLLKLLGELPPDTMKKVESLGKILQQDLKEGKLTDAQMHEELMSGNLEQKLRGLNPEAGPLLDLTVRSLRLFDDFVTRVSADSGMAIPYQRTGTLQVALTAGAMAELTASAAGLAMRQYGPSTNRLMPGRSKSCRISRPK